MVDTTQAQANLDSAFASPTIRPVTIPVPGVSGFGGPTSTSGLSVIDQLRSELGRNGTPQLNRFQANINPPAILGEGAQTLRQMMIRTHSILLPGNTLDTATDSNIYGPDRAIVSGISFADSVQVKFYMDEKFDIRKYFQQWQKLMYNEGTWNLKYYSEYIGTLDIFVLNRDFRPTAGYRIWEAYPSTIGGIEFSMESSDIIKDFSVDFNFRYWSDISEHGTEQPTNKQKRIAASIADNEPE